MKINILFLLIFILGSCSSHSKEQNSHRVNDKERLITGVVENEDDQKDKSICNCFYGNEMEYEFRMPRNCNSEVSLLICIPDTTSFHEDGFRYKMFNVYGDILQALSRRKFSGKMLAYYDKDQKHKALELNMLNGELNGTMKAYSFDGEEVIHREFKDGSLSTVKKDIGQVNWSFNKESNELKVSESYLNDESLSLYYSPDTKQESIIDWETAPHEVFSKMKPLKVNKKLFSGEIMYYGDHEGFTPLPVAKLSFSKGLLNGKVTFFGDYEDYPAQFDPWVISKELHYTNGNKSASQSTFDDIVLYKGSAFVNIDGEEVRNEFQLWLEFEGNIVQEAGSFELSNGFPNQYYILNGEKKGDKLEIVMVGVFDARMSSIENAIANGEKHTVTFLIDDYSLKYIGDSEGCDYCSEELSLKKYDPTETEHTRFLKPY